MPLFLYASGITFVTVMEESVGYSYFYSLRFAFGHEAPWLPQIQLLMPLHAMIQYLLTLFGLPVNQLFPRIDLYCMLAIIPPAILSGLAFVRLSSIFHRKIWPLFICIIFVFMMTSPNLPGGISWTLMPYYPVWVVPLAIFSATLLPKNVNKSSEKNHKTRLWFFWMGVLVAAAAGIKLTFALFPLTVLAACALNCWNWRETPKLLFLSAVTSLLTISLIYWVAAGFAGKSEMLSYLKQSKIFLSNPMWGAVASPTFVNPLLVVSSLPLLLSLSALYLGVKRQNWGVAVTGVFGVIYTIFVFMRFYDQSLIEYHAFILMPLVQLACLRSDCSINPIGKRTMLVMYTLSVVLAYYIAMYLIWPVIRDVPPNYLAGNIDTVEFRQRLEAGPGPIWILTTDNSYRPYSIESAMCKGGVNIMSDQWGDSPYIMKLFPRFHCSIKMLPIEMAPKDREGITKGTIGFARLKDESLQSAMIRVEHSFGISLNESTCHEIVSKITNWYPTMIYCYPQKRSSNAK